MRTTKEPAPKPKRPRSDCAAGASATEGLPHWAERRRKRWAFTLSNAGANYFEDRCNLDQLQEINWDAVAARQWSGRGISSAIKEGKQAEFLLEERLPWKLVERVGVRSLAILQQAREAIGAATHQPRLEIQGDWYY